MNRLDQLYRRLNKIKIPKQDKTSLKLKIKHLEKVATLFHACGDLVLLQAKKLKEEL